MKRVVLTLTLIALAGCSSSGSEPDAGSSGTVAVESATPSAPELSQSPTELPSAPVTTAPATQPATKTPKPVATGAGDVTFCDYLAQNADAAQLVESPEQFVELVQGALAVAPGSIRDDLSLYADSVEKLATTVTGSAAEAKKADAWLSRNDAAVQQAQDNLNSYSLSTCGQPFITGEGN